MSDAVSKFIMEALKDGWTVSMNTHGEFEFIKDKHKMSELEKQEAFKTGYSQKFLKKLSSKMVEH